MPEQCARCEQPVTATKQAHSASINHDEASQARTCVIARDNNLVINFHTHQDLEATIDETPDDAPDPDELTGEHHTVYNAIHFETMDGGTIREAELAGKLAANDIPPGDVKEIARELAASGYVEAPDDAVYRVREAPA